MPLFFCREAKVRKKTHNLRLLDVMTWSKGFSGEFTKGDFVGHVN